MGNQCNELTLAGMPRDIHATLVSHAGILSLPWYCLNVIFSDESMYACSASAIHSVGSSEHLILSLPSKINIEPQSLCVCVLSFKIYMSH